MMARSERDVILEHALRDEDNLSIALMIGATYEDLCGRIIASFLDAVEGELATRLGRGWQVTSCRDLDVLAAADSECLVARFLGNPAKFRVVLGADEKGYPKSPYLALRSDQHQEGAVCENLKRALDEDFALGKASAYSIWYRYIDKAYSAWGSEDILIRMHRKDDVVTYFAGRLECIAQVLEKVLRSYGR